MITKRCKRCENYLDGRCIGSVDICFNAIKYSRNKYGEISCMNCNYGDYCK